MDPLLLTSLPPTSDTNPLDADCTKRSAALFPPPLSIFPTHTGLLPPPSLTSPSPTSSTASEHNDASPDPALVVARLWTGAPIRAIVPLPRRARHCKLSGPFHRARDDVVLGSSSTPPPSPSSFVARSTRFWTDDTDMLSDADSESEGDNKDGDDNGNDGQRNGYGYRADEDADCDDAAMALRCCSYESITAAKGLSAWSFEELRVECYAQSLVARGTKPPPAVQPTLAIPPAFVPRIVPRN